MIVTEYRCIHRDDYEDEETYTDELINASTLHEIYGVDPDDVFTDGKYNTILFEAYLHNRELSYEYKGVNHLNYPDKQGHVYCRAKNKIIELNFDDCPQCPLLYGSIQGNGVECFYLDSVDKNNHWLALSVIEPQQQLAHINSLIDDDMLPIDPFIMENIRNNPLISL